MQDICKKCIHKVVCKEIDNYRKYVGQYLEMRKISSLFDKDPECPYYKIQEIEGRQRFFSDVVEEYLKMHSGIAFEE